MDGTAGDVAAGASEAYEERLALRQEVPSGRWLTSQAEKSGLLIMTMASEAPVSA